MVLVVPVLLVTLATWGTSTPPWPGATGPGCWGCRWSPRFSRVPASPRLSHHRPVRSARPGGAHRTARRRAAV